MTMITTGKTSVLRRPIAQPLAGIAAAVRAALARRKARYDARRVLAAGDRILLDAGTTREDVRLALQERGGR